MTKKDIMRGLIKRAMTKRAALQPDITLMPHQQRVLTKWTEENPPGMLIYHGLGSGKTPTSIAVGEAMPGQKNVIVPASLRENYKKQLKQFSTDPKPYNILSYTEAMRRKMDPTAVNIFDEAHRMGREGTDASRLINKIPGRKLLLTGTPVRNEPAEIVPILKAIAPDRPIPQTAEAFNQQFITTGQVMPGFLSKMFLGVKPGERPEFKNVEEFKKLIKGRVDYQKSQGEFPTATEDHVDVPMTPHQSNLYRGVMGNSPLAWKIRLNLPPSRSEAAKLNAFLTGTRQISNNPAAYDTRLIGDPVDHSPKIQRMIADIQQHATEKPNFKGLVYSNYLDAGIVPMAARLTKLGIPSAVFSGEMNDKLRRKVVEDYNNGDIKVLLVSGAGSEGLDLKGTKLVQLMEPHWNLARTKQVIGRAIRHKSHSHLPPEERNVDVKWYYAKPKQSMFANIGLVPRDRGVDRYLHTRAMEKQRIINQMLRVMRESGMENTKAAMVGALEGPLGNYLVSAGGMRVLQRLIKRYQMGAQALQDTSDLLSQPNEEEEKEAASDLSFGSGGSPLGQMADYGNRYGSSGMVNWVPPIELKYKHLNDAIMKRINPIKDPAAKRHMSRMLLTLLMGKQAVSTPGLPDPRRFGDPRQILKNRILEWVVQEHKARRAGRHLDVRFGEPGGKPSLYSWATKKELPKPGDRPVMLFQQPLHTGTYADFKGTIPSGYGAGTVNTHDRGKMIVTEASPEKIKFVTIHKGEPEYFTMIRRSGRPTGDATSRQRQTQGGSWLMFNSTPLKAENMLGGDPKSIGLDKLKFTSVPADKVEKVFDPAYLNQPKVDGASLLYHVLHDRIDAISYRQSKLGRPIVHTMRVFGPGGTRPTKALPKELEGSILRGEVYGMRDNKVLPPQELGGVLNASVFNSIEKQRQQRIRMKNMIFDVVRRGKQNVPPGERLKTLAEIHQYLPPNRFHQPETAQTPEESKALWQQITSGKHPLTQEGIVAWPKEEGRPIKVKVMPEADVWIKGTFPIEGKYKDTHAGGVEYATSPEGPVVGRIGSGFSNEDRQDMIQNPGNWVDRMARIRSQGTFPSGAHRAPSFIARHEDYPLQKEALNSFTQSQMNKLRAATNPDIPILHDPHTSMQGLYAGPNMEERFITDVTQRIKQFGGTPALRRRIQTKKFKQQLRDKGFIYGRDVNKHPILAHELGHASGDNEMIYPSAVVQSAPISGLINASASAAAGYGAYSKPKGFGDFVKRVAVGGAFGAGIGALSRAPTLFEEGRASLRGLKALREAGFSDNDITQAKDWMWKAYKSYLWESVAPPAAWGAAGAGAGSALALANAGGA